MQKRTERKTEEELGLSTLPNEKCHACPSEVLTQAGGHLNEIPATAEKWITVIVRANKQV